MRLVVSETCRAGDERKGERGREGKMNRKVKMRKRWRELERIKKNSERVSE